MIQVAALFVDRRGHFLDGEDLLKVLREAARNAMQDVLLVQDEQALEAEERRLARANETNAEVAA